MAAQQSPLSQIIPVGDRAWQEVQPGVRMKHLWADEQTHRRAGMSRIEPSARVPLHRHVGDELIFVMEGANADEAGVVPPGNMNSGPAGCAHPVTTKNGATVLAVVRGRVEPVS